MITKSTEEIIKRLRSGYPSDNVLCEAADRLEELQEDAGKWQYLMKAFSRPDKMRTDVAKVWDSRNVSQG